MDIEEAKELITEGLASTDYSELIDFLQSRVERRKQWDLELLEGYLDRIHSTCVDLNAQIETRDVEQEPLSTILEEGYAMVDGFIDELQNQIQIVQGQRELSGRMTLTKVS